jgi:hypothetical protein
MKSLMAIIVFTLVAATAPAAFAGQHNGPTTGCDKFFDSCSQKNDTYKTSHANYKNNGPASNQQASN